MSCFDSTHAPVATAAHAAATGLVSMSTRPDPEGSGSEETLVGLIPCKTIVTHPNYHAHAHCYPTTRSAMFTRNAFQPLSTRILTVVGFRVIQDVVINVMPI